MKSFFFLSLSTSENSLHFNFSSLVTKRIFFWLERGRRHFLISILFLTEASRSISTCLYLFSHFSFLDFWRQRTIFGANACAKKCKFLFPETRTFFCAPILAMDRSPGTKCTYGEIETMRRKKNFSSQGSAWTSFKLVSNYFWDFDVGIILKIRSAPPYVARCTAVHVLRTTLSFEILLAGQRCRRRIKLSQISEISEVGSILGFSKLNVLLRNRTIPTSKSQN